MEGKIEGKAPRGRPRDKHLGQVKKDRGKKSHREVKELTLDRKEWRAIVYQSKDYNTRYNNKKDTGKKSHREVKELALDRKEWRAAVYQFKDYNTRYNNKDTRYNRKEWRTAVYRS
jgi:hypothetical protein